MVKSEFFLSKIRENPFVVSNVNLMKELEKSKDESQEQDEFEKRASKKGAIRMYRNAEIVAKFYK